MNNTFNMHSYTMCSATAQMLLSCGFLAVDAQLGKYLLLCQEKWLAYYTMSEAIVSQHTHEVPTVCGKKALLTDSTPAMWKAVQEWRELNDNVTSYHHNCLLNGIESMNDGRYNFIDMWARHLVLWAIHNGGCATQSLMNITYNEYSLSTCGEYLPDLED